MADDREIMFLDVPGRRRATARPRVAIRYLEALHRKHGFDRLAATPLDVPDITDNPYWDIVRLMPRDDHLPFDNQWRVSGWGTPDGVPSPLRRSLTLLYAFAIPSPSDLLWLQAILDGRGVVEVGAGNGYWAWQLTQLGIDVAAVDDRSWHQEWAQHWHPVEDGNTWTAKRHSDRALMLIWPPYSSPMAAAALDFYEGDLVIYAGEGHGGCTGDDEFHERLESDWDEIGESPHHPTFDGIHCRLTAYRRSGRNASCS